MRPDAALIVTPRLDDNSTGRSYVTWLLLRALGWRVRVISVGTSDSPMWAPMRDTEFSRDCEHLMVSRRPGAAARPISRLVNESALLVATKALPESFGVLRRSAWRLGRDIVLDYDDPDLEPYLPSDVSLRELALRYGRHPVKSGRYIASYARVRRNAGRIRLVVSNPALRETRGGVVIPHLRDDLGPGPRHLDTQPTIGFIGSVRPHKGIESLRQAARVAGDLELVLTAPQPADASSNEKWIGERPYEESMELIRKLDIVVVPSEDTLFARGQLPAKIMDGMFASRLVVASDLPPARWALGNTGLLYQPGDVDALASALRRGADPELRERLGLAARKRAQRTFSVAAQLEVARSVFGSPDQPRP